MLPLLDAQRLVAALPLRSLPSESVAVERAPGRVLAAAPASDLELPPFDRVTMDGFAVRAADAASGGELAIVGAIAAGATAPRALAAGEAFRIMTGAPLPAGANAVVPIEESQVRGDRVRFQRAPKPGQNVHPRGVDLKRGARPLAPGERVTTARVALLATMGQRNVEVFRRPQVAILTTGNELVEPDVVPTGGQIRDSNRFALAGQVASAGCDFAIHPIVRDDRAALTAAVESALDSNHGSSHGSDHGSAREGDVVLITGGSSAGDFDYSKEVLLALDGRLWFEQVQIKPGKPVLLFTLRERVVFCLPGNPVSAFVTFEVLVRPLLERLAGAPECWPVPDELALTAPLQAPAERDLLQVARIEATAPGRPTIAPVRWSGSGDLVAIAAANALIHLRKRESAAAGAPVRVLPFRSAWDDLPRARAPVT